MFSIKDLGHITDVRNGAVWTPEELRGQIGRRIARLNELGVMRNDRVVIAHGGTPEFFADLFAAWSLGAYCVCVNPTLTKGELETIVHFVEPRAILVLEESPGPAAVIRIPVLDAGEGRAMPSDVPDVMALKAQDPALILFTSGTTGNPKGVVHTGGTLSARVEHNRRHLGDPVLKRTLCVLPTHFGHGLIGNCLTPLAASAHLFLFPTPGIQGAARIGGILQDHRITFMSSVPAFWKIVLKAARPPGERTLKQIGIGSAPLSAELWKSVISWSGIDNVWNMYGITETANWAAGATAQSFEPEDGLVGTMWGGKAAVADSDGNLHGEGEGEIVLRTPSLMTGYYRRDDLTAEVIRNGWYYTGDLGSIDSNGHIRLLGRIKTEINRAGMKVLPEEVDMLLERHPAVAEACTFGVPHPVNGEMVAVAVRLMDENVTPGQLRQWCQERIRVECVPEKWYVVTEIPKTDRGKINRAKVRDACLRKGN